jgi:hypothetical protein
MPWRIVATDSFLALVCGREIATHGLPHTDALAVVSAGRTWTDQQWLGQLSIWAVGQVGGLRTALAFQALVTAAAYAICARHALSRGASPAATFVCGVAGFGLGAPFFTLRPQMFSLLGFAALLVLLSDDVRSPSKRVFWALPILVLWANLHGAMVLGVGLVMLRVAFDVAAQRVLGGLFLGGLSAVTPFCSPYARELPRYFREIGHLQDPARDLPIMEWNRVTWPDDWPFFAIFGVLAILLAVVHIKRLSRPSVFETLVIVGFGLGAWQASRHLQWFGLAVAAYAPLALDGVPAIREGRVLALVASSARWAGSIGLLVVLVRLCVISTAKVERKYPNGAIGTLAQLADEHPDWHLASSDHFADWALWHVPALRGRLEADVRFELLDDAHARDMSTWLSAKPGWENVYPDARMALVARKEHPLLDRKIVTLPGAHVVWENDIARLVVW